MDTTEAGTLQLEGGTLPLPFADALAPPVRLGPYDDVRPFACGGMGMVCRARQRMPDREVAIKVLRAGTRASAAQKERFLREIRLAANLDHPGIVPVFDAGEQDGWLYFVMPFLEDAESLIDHAVSQRLDWRARLSLAVRAADIVEVLHRGGMLHRDLKPGNILVDRHGEVRLLDFGLATALEPQIDGPRLSCGGIAGTPAYLSPEQAAGVPARELTAAADVYALGVVTYELLTGHMPYEVECPLPEILRSIREARPAAPSSFVLDLPPAVEQVILRALSKDPSRRPADAGAYAAALRRALDTATGRRPSGSPWLSRGRTVWAALAVGLVRLLAAGATTLHRVLDSHAAVTPARSAQSPQPQYPAAAASAAPGIPPAAEVAPPAAQDAPGRTSMADGGAVTSEGETGIAQQGAGIAITAARIVFVRPNAVGAGNGTSWADAYTDLQPALAAAVNGDEIWVAAGTYKPTTGSDRSLSFQMRRGVGLYGGFAGTETLRTQRDWTTNETVLSGDIGAPGDNTDNSRHVVKGANSARLDGFTITSGNADGVGEDAMGGGMANRGCSPTVANSLFISNAARNQGGAAGNYGSAAVLTDCVFYGNTAGMGAGAVINGASTSTITHCVFAGNSSGEYGGALHIGSCPSLDVDSCVFVGNHAADRGGAVSCSVSTPRLRDCLFVGNQAKAVGSAVELVCGTPRITNCTFAQNSAVSGGAIYSLSLPTGATHVTITNAVLWGNTTSTGAAEIMSLAKAGSPQATTTLISTLVAGGWDGPHVSSGESCTIGDGGGNLDADPAFVGAVATGVWTAVGTCSPTNGRMTLTCTGAAWTPAAFAGLILNPDIALPDLFYIVSNTVDTITIYGDTTSFTAVGDAFQVNDYRLRPASSCIDAGLGDADTPVNDLAGNARYDDPSRPNTGTGTPPYVDLGAYEFQGTQPAAVPPATVGVAAPVPASGQDWTVPDLGMEFVWVGPGEFQMGAKDGEDHERPVHPVRISHGFWLGRYEVTQAEYQALAEQRADPGSGARLPVVEVSWYGAEAFCRKLTERERGAGRLPEGCEYRLPTEAEWEYAARGGTQSRGTVYAGSDRLDEVAWHMNNSRGAPHPVGGKEPNELGIHDLTGNVWEWCLDWSDPGFYSRSPAANPLNAEAATLRVTRGGSWVHVAEWARLSHRGGWRPERANDNIGFRVSLAPAIATPAQ